MLTLNPILIYILKLRLFLWWIKISISSSNSYCPNCKKVVRTTRGEIDVGLAILLFCCTGGIGFVIYLIIYFSKPEDRCVFCSQPTEPYSGQKETQNEQNLYGQPQPGTSSTPVDSPKEDLNYCPNCGAKIDPSAKYCEFCGTEL